MSIGSASHRHPASGNKCKTHHLTFEETNQTTRTDPPLAIINVDGAQSPNTGNQSQALTNLSALDKASTRIKAFVWMLHYPQQRAVFKDNAMCYITTFTEFYHKSKSILKTKDDPTYCPPSCRISITLQSTQHINESTVFKALADELAWIANELCLHVAVQVLKCKCLNNADKQRESTKIYAKGLVNMAEIILAEVNMESTRRAQQNTTSLQTSSHTMNRMHLATSPSPSSAHQNLQTNQETLNPPPCTPNPTRPNPPKC